MDSAAATTNSSAAPCTVALDSLVLDVLASGEDFANPSLGQVGQQMIFDEATIIWERPFQVTCFFFGTPFPHKMSQGLESFEEIDLKRHEVGASPSLHKGVLM